MTSHLDLEALFLEAAELAPERRAAFLDARCGTDSALRARLESLLAREAGGGALSLAPVVKDPLEAAPPPVLGPYRLGEKLGEGGFGQVYAADQTEPVRRRVAIKILHAGLDSRAVLARFEAERHALARMDHPGIARVLDAGATPEGRPYFVMELVAGIPITEYCDHGRLGVRARLGLMIAVCRAVEHAHQKGVIHRDLKPSNLLVTVQDGAPVPKVIDFGIAKATHAAGEETLHTRAGEFLGTPEYASPEQSASGGADVDTRSDVYSLGVVLYRLLTGRLPFESERVRAAGPRGLAGVLRESDPPRPSVVAGALVRPSDLRGDLDWITLRALEREPDRRYPSAAALADDLERHLAERPVVAGPPAFSYRLGKFVRRNRPLTVGTLAVALALVAGVVATLWQAGRAREESAIAAAVNAFLTRMVAGANPEAHPEGRETSVREMVDRAAATLEAGGAARPAVEAGIRHAIGATYLGLGLYDRAEAQLARAADLRAREAGPDARVTLESRLALAELAVRRGRYAAAESALAAIGTRRRALNAHADLRLRHLQLTGGNLGNLSRNEEADSVHAAAVTLARTSAAGAAALAASLGELAEIRNRRGLYDDAARLGREALALIRAESTGPSHAMAAAISRLAVIETDAGRFATAESLHREALALDRRILGPGHPTVAERLSTVASVLVEQGRLTEAEGLHREAIAILSAALGETHPTLAIARGQLATLLQSRGALGEALALRRQVLDATRRHFGERHVEVANALNNLGSTLRLEARYDEAAARFGEALAIFRELHGPAHGTVAVVTHNRGKTLLDAGRVVEGEREVRAAVEAARQVFPPGHVNVAIFEATWGRALSALGREAAAESLLLASHARMEAELGGEHPRAKETAAELAKLYGRTGRATEAARWRARSR